MANIDLKAIDLKLLKEEIKILNEGGDLESKFKVVGTSKEKLVDAFGKAIDYLDDKEKNIPDTCINFYNSIFSEPEKTDPPADPPAEKDKKDKPKRKPPVASKKIASFEDIQERIKDPSNPTAHMDHLMLAGGKIETLIAKLKEYLDESKIAFSGFRTVSSVKRHIEYREEHGWVYEKDGDKIKLVGFKAKK